MVRPHVTYRAVLAVAAVFRSYVLATQSHDDDKGLKVDTTKKAFCERPTRDGDALKVHYRGSLETTGEEFETSFDGEPFEFTLGRGEVIEGWDKGLLDMCAGEHRTLTIPPSLAYGDHGTGNIPPNSTLVFETVLVSNEQVKHRQDNTTKTSEGDAESTQIDIPGAKDGECRLLGPFAILVQAALGILALLSLVWKRWRETPPRPLKVWFFDVSKQVFGSILLHVANLFMSVLSSQKLDISTTRKPTSVVTATLAVRSATRSQPNPCSFYLLNLAIDTTLGIPILVFLLYVLHRMFSLTPLASPPESIRSGHYGDPPKASWWFKQAMIYFLGLFGMKLCVFFVFQVFPWIGWVGDWALRWTEGNEAVQITFVMFIFPVIMNAVQYYIIDTFIKERKSNVDGHTLLPGEDEDEVEDDEIHHRQLNGEVRDYNSLSNASTEGETKKRLMKGEEEVRSSEDMGNSPADYDPQLDGEGSKKTP